MSEAIGPNGVIKYVY